MPPLLVFLAGVGNSACVRVSVWCLCVCTHAQLPRLRASLTAACSDRFQQPKALLRSAVTQPLLPPLRAEPSSLPPDRLPRVCERVCVCVCVSV